VLMSVWGGENPVTQAAIQVRPIAPGVGQIVCPECGGNQKRYRSFFPPELGITRCVDCKGTGLVCVSI
jgi:hypothetical protein